MRRACVLEGYPSCQLLEPRRDARTRQDEKGITRGVVVGRVKVGAEGSRHPREVSPGRKSILDGTTATDQSLSVAAGGWWGHRRARRLSVKGFPSQGSVTSPVGSSVTPCVVVHRTPLSVGFRRHWWVAVSFSRGSSQLRGRARVSCIGTWIFRR